MLVGSSSEHLLAGAWEIHAIPNPWGNGDQLRFLGNTRAQLWIIYIGCLGEVCYNYTWFAYRVCCIVVQRRAGPYYREAYIEIL